MENAELTVTSQLVLPEFKGWSKIHRLHRLTIISEKIDGCNCQVYITPEGGLFVGSRNQWLLPGKETDHYGFAGWAYAHMDELVRGLGPGRHFGEWFGRKIQRGYGMKTKAFALFNTSRWKDDRQTNETLRMLDLDAILPHRTQVPECCTVVPILDVSNKFDSNIIEDCLHDLSDAGSVIAPGFETPEGIIVYHTVSQTMMKCTIADDGPKSLSPQPRWNFGEDVFSNY